MEICRALVGMVMYNGETAEIAKPSELLSSVRAYMSILQTVENHGLSVFQLNTYLAMSVLFKCFMFYHDSAN